VPRVVDEDGILPAGTSGEFGSESASDLSLGRLLIDQERHIFGRKSPKGRVRENLIDGLCIGSGKAQIRNAIVLITIDPDDNSVAGAPRCVGEVRGRARDLA
jgi:hypothetical protein